MRTGGVSIFFMNPVHIHSALAFHGGAARVAGMVGMAASRAGYNVSFSCEISDGPRAADRMGQKGVLAHILRCASPDFGAGAPRVPSSFAETAFPGASEWALRRPASLASGNRSGVLHMHSTQDWEGFFAALLERPAAGRGLLLTLHDARPLTGGCIHPLACRAWVDACARACPMGCPDAALHGRKLRALLRAVKPRLACPSAWLGKMAREALPECGCRIIPNGVEDPAVMFEQMCGGVLPDFGPHDRISKGSFDAPRKDVAPRLGRAKALARRSMGVVRSAKVVLFAAHGGETCRSKGGDKWMGIWRGIKAAVPEAVCVMAGGERLERCGDVLFWPYAGREVMILAMLAADVLVHVSPAENHPLAILEAFAAGVPVCAFAVGGVPEQIVDGACGRLHPCGDYDGLIRSVIALLRRPATLRNWSFAARERYERFFTMRRMCGEYLKAYEEILSEQGGTQAPADILDG